MTPLDERVILAKIDLLKRERGYKMDLYKSLLAKRALTEDEVKVICHEIDTEYEEEIGKLEDQLKLLRM